mmetsp:Transcript_18252/g.46068  ORF Transcript_18252/g.46068 Transcript_18252/m.46068 type:complete len:120 (-) Transcript_18252:1967-2326(-)
MGGRCPRTSCLLHGPLAIACRLGAGFWVQGGDAPSARQCRQGTGMMKWMGGRSGWRRALVISLHAPGYQAVVECTGPAREILVLLLLLPAQAGSSAAGSGPVRLRHSRRVLTAPATAAP